MTALGTKDGTSQKIQHISHGCGPLDLLVTQYDKGFIEESSNDGGMVDFQCHRETHMQPMEWSQYDTVALPRASIIGGNKAECILY